jgi:hypothetical protein
MLLLHNNAYNKIVFIDYMAKPNSYNLTTLAIMGGLLAGSGCASQKIKERTTELLTAPNISIDDALIRKGEHPIFEEGTQVTYQPYNQRVTMAIPLHNTDVERAQELLLTELGAGYTISSSPKTGRIMVGFSYSDIIEQGSYSQQDIESIVSQRTSSIQNLINMIDVEPPQYRIEARVTRIFATNTEELNTRILTTLHRILEAEETNFGYELNPSNGTGTINGGIYSFGGVFLRGSSQIALDVLFNNLIRHGYAEDLANPVIVVENAEEATISNTLQVPVPKQIISGGTTINVSEYTDVRNYLTITPHARSGRRVSLELQAGVGEITPSGRDIPNISTREMTIGRVTLGEGDELLVGSFIDTRTLGETRGTTFGISDTNQERTVNLILYRIKPNQVYTIIQENQEDKE